MKDITIEQCLFGKKENRQFSMARELNDFIHEVGIQIRQKCMRLIK